MKRPDFKSEAELCAAFIRLVPKDWVAYPETGGFDILLVGPAGVQVGIEAKLALNAKVVIQALAGLVHPPDSGWSELDAAPDHRAVLVPIGAGSSELGGIAAALGITVISVFQEHEHFLRPAGLAFRPELPGSRSGAWHDFCPATRIELPEYVPDVVAGASAPTALTRWKIGAIKLVLIAARRGYVTRSDFQHVGIDSSRWVRPPRPWLDARERGRWVISERTPDFAAQHRRNFAEIEADFEKWAPDDLKGAV